jgi:heme/copper-type cytochrome/quinol oxidase subunit 2
VTHPSRALAALAAAGTLLLAGCGGSTSTEGGSGGSATGSQAGAGSSSGKQQMSPVTVDVHIKDGEVSPEAERVDVKVGQPVELNVTSDAPDEIHVHSEPDHEFEVEPGRQQTFSFTINRPGVYEVESHENEALIISLAVRP